MRDQWTATRVSLLQRLWASGVTAEAIAAELGGLSRSAVLGKIYRLRGAGKSTIAPTLRPLRRRRAKQNEPSPAVPCCELKSLLDLTNHCCRWPIARPGRGILFCGAPGADLAGGMPYCAYHARRAYVIPPKRAVAAKRKAASPEARSDAVSKVSRRYVWRAPVRHPAPRFR